MNQEEIEQESTIFLPIIFLIILPESTICIRSCAQRIHTFILCTHVEELMNNDVLIFPSIFVLFS